MSETATTPQTPAPKATPAKPATPAAAPTPTVTHSTAQAAPNAAQAVTTVKIGDLTVTTY